MIAPLTEIGPFRERLLSFCKARRIRGTILLSAEGIQMLVCVADGQLDALLTEIRGHPGLATLEATLTGSRYQPFERMVVRVQKGVASLEATELALGLKASREHLAQVSATGPGIPSEEQIAENIAHRHRLIRKAVDPLPGRAPSDQFKPVNIPQRMDGRTLLDVVCAAVSHVPRSEWEREFSAGLLVNASDAAVGAGHIVRAGERYRHKIPGVIEPDVAGDVRILHEDEALLVVSKPAPLPMHAGGRFHRNTLQHILNTIYHPETPRPAHRLDANTTGIVLVARSQLFAGRLQTQFARGLVKKRYLVRAQGHPPSDIFSCDAPISSQSGRLGSRQVDFQSGLAARTEFHAIRRSGDGATLLEARPITGRTNQIRVHLWHLGYPVCGDPAYLPGGKLGDTQTLPVNAAPLCLHAWRIAFTHPMTQEAIEFTAPPPPWVEGVMVSNLP
ncbi:MAG: RluA family pseudouridine synthase [Verrucomicrobia bacterium]|nr:RluA family pseudouridine synthase [Verrucomicrobiota bacterium]MBI3871033.1 RluA family pseudouridine synthase [Verrucomicrobiota bacterium]